MIDGCGHYKRKGWVPRGTISMKGKRTRRRPKTRSQRGRGLFNKVMAYNARPGRLPGVAGYLGAKLALKVLGPKAQKRRGPYMPMMKKLTFI